MHRFFAEEDGTIVGEELAHLTRVLRLSVGDEIEALINGRRFQATIETIDKEAAKIALGEELPSHEPKCRVTLYQGMCKGDKMDFIVQKCTEMGVSAIVPVEMKWSVVKIDKKDKKTDRYNKIAREAVKQCGRSAVPKVCPPMTLKEALASMKKHQSLLMPYENGGDAFNGKITDTDIGILIGPEGGIAPEEVEAVREIGGKPVTLGSRILRTETAGLVALTLTMHCAGELGGE